MCRVLPKKEKSVCAFLSHEQSVIEPENTGGNTTLRSTCLIMLRQYNNRLKGAVWTQPFSRGITETKWTWCGIHFEAYLTVVVWVMEGGLLVTTPILLGSYGSVGGCAAACPNCWITGKELSVWACAILIKGKCTSLQYSLTPINMIDHYAVISSHLG